MGKRILAVEDALLLAFDLEEMLTKAGCRVLGPVPTAARAIRLIERHVPDAAVLDINLHDHDSMPVADELADRRIPFVFATGYEADVLPKRHRSRPLLSKPYDSTRIVEALAQLLDRMS